MVAKAATSNASLQLHCATPKRLDPTSQSAVAGKRTSGVPEHESTADVRTSRYRLLDERERVRESQEIERIVQQLHAQRRPKSKSMAKKTSDHQQRQSLTNKAKETRPSLAGSPQRQYEDDAPPAYDSIYESTQRRRHSAASYGQHDEIPSPQWSDGDGGGGDEAVALDECAPRQSAAVAPLPSTDFQERVLQELQKLKQAQQKDLEAIQKLQREKADAERRATALEATLRQQQQQHQRHTPATREPTLARASPAKLAFGDLETGDMSAPPSDDHDGASPVSLSSPPPPRYAQSPSQSFRSETLDFTDGEDESAPSSPLSLSSGLAIQPCDSPVFTKSQRQVRRVSARTSSHNGSRAPSEERPRRRPQSARSTTNYTDDGDDTDDDVHDQRRGRSRLRCTSSHGTGRDGTSGSRPSSRPRSASRDELRRSCAFHEAKLKAQQQDEELQRETQQKLDRAARATPPANLLKRQAEAQRKTQELLRKIEMERDAELAPAKRVRARDVPATTYVASDAFATTDEREQARRERVMKRSQELLAQAALPTRMNKVAQDTVATTTMGGAAAAVSMSVKMRRRLQEQLAEQQTRKQLLKPKPVPNFTHLQQQWEKALSVKKSLHKPTEPQSFFTARERELDDLKARKAARKQKLVDQELQMRRDEAAKQRLLLEKVKRRSSGPTTTSGVSDTGPRLTKSDALRMKKVQETLRQQRRALEQQQLETERRALRSQEASRRVTAQVKHGEQKRKGEYAGEFVELTAVESVAKQRAATQRAQFKEAVQRNKERLLQAVAAKPSLMERFAMDLRREENKKQALETVVKHVFQNNFKDMKGILTEDEEDLARDLVAADGGDDQEEKEKTTRENGNSEDAYANDDDDEA